MSYLDPRVFRGRCSMDAVKLTVGLIFYRKGRKLTVQQVSVSYMFIVTIKTLQYINCARAKHTVAPVCIYSTLRVYMFTLPLFFAICSLLIVIYTA